MLVSAIQLPVLSLAVVLFLFGLLVLTGARSGEVFNMKVEWSGSRGKPALAAGATAMLFGLLLGWVAVRPEGGRASATTGGTTTAVTAAVGTTATGSAARSTTVVTSGASEGGTASTVATPTTAGGSERRIPSNEMLVTASSALPSEKGCGGTCYYVADNVKDGSTYTAWAEGAAGLGEGEHLDFVLGAPRHLTRITIVAGWQRGEECLYVRNGRPSKVRLAFGEAGEREVDIPDIRAPYDVTLDVVASRVVVTIDAVWPTSDCGGRPGSTDTLITDIVFYERAT